MSQPRPIGIPMQVLFEAKGQTVTCEDTRGDVYRGKLVEAEENMNCLLSEVKVTYRDGKTADIEDVYIRGRTIRSLLLPDILKESTLLEGEGRRLTQNGGRGKTAFSRSQAGRGRGRAGQAPRMKDPRKQVPNGYRREDARMEDYRRDDARMKDYRRDDAGMEDYRRNGYEREDSRRECSRREGSRREDSSGSRIRSSDNHKKKYSSSNGSRDRGHIKDRLGDHYGNPGAGMRFKTEEQKEDNDRYHWP